MHYLRSFMLKALPGVVHGFGTKDVFAGRISREDWRGKSLEDEAGSFSLVSVRQIHGEEIILFSGASLESTWEMEADALITREPGYALGVFTADCLPILFFDPVRRAIGVVHSGWRGTAKGLAYKTVLKMQKAFGSRGEDLIAALGPCIGPCCYEVDEPVRAAFAAGGIPWERVVSQSAKGSWRLDLRAANMFLLEKCGVRREKIASVSECTSCHRDRFFSYRAEGQTGRQLNFIALRA